MPSSCPLLLLVLVVVVSCRVAAFDVRLSSQSGSYVTQCRGRHSLGGRGGLRLRMLGVIVAFHSVSCAGEDVRRVQRSESLGPRLRSPALSAWSFLFSVRPRSGSACRSSLRTASAEVRRPTRVKEPRSRSLRSLLNGLAAAVYLAVLHRRMLRPAMSSLSCTAKPKPRCLPKTHTCTESFREEVIHYRTPRPGEVWLVAVPTRRFEGIREGIRGMSGILGVGFPYISVTPLRSVGGSSLWPCWVSSHWSSRHPQALHLACT